MRHDTAPTPTSSQQRRLRSLAERTATTFAAPRTRAEASREISRLERLERAPHAASRDGREEDDPETLTHTPIRQPQHRPASDRSPMRKPAETPPMAPRRLGRYLIAADTELREVVAIDRPDGAVLVIDRERVTHDDPRLVAELHAEEPSANAELICRLYLADENHRTCRALTDEDLHPQGAPVGETPAVAPPQIIEHDGHHYTLTVTAGRSTRGELRWARTGGEGDPQTHTLREVIAAVERYEPACTITRAAVAAHHPDEQLSVTTLKAELERITASPIVLNRRLREKVEHAVAAGHTLSEIAIRCGRTKRDGHGNRSGETSWLGRRIGRLPESGSSHPTPWVHTDTLALIAREGLRVSPRDVEL